MWPWEHLALGYLAYSLSVRAATGEPPRRGGAYAAAAGALAPDLVDKPLSWSLGVFASGYSVAHSVFAATAVVAVAAPALAASGRARAGAGFAVGYASHLVGDILYPVAFGEAPALSRVLWPFVTHSGYTLEYGAVRRAGWYLARYLYVLSQPGARRLLALELAFLAAAAALWFFDGTPGLPRSPAAQSPEQPPE
jgi:hypothetical protein